MLSINVLARKGVATPKDLFTDTICALILSHGKYYHTEKNEEYDLVIEEVHTMTDPEQSKIYIANFYESLYQVRERNGRYKEWTDRI